MADITGCGSEQTEAERNHGEKIYSDDGNGEKAKIERQKILSDSREIIESYAYMMEQRDEYETADSLKLQRDIIAHLGKEGYTAVDIENQIDMANYEKAEKFCGEALEGKKTELTIFLVMDGGGFIRYDLRADNGKMGVLTSSAILENGMVRTDYLESFTVSSWKYTEKGYLFFEQQHMEGFDGAPGQTAVRIKPLDSKLRRLNRKYVMPAGYRGNMLLLADWDEKNYSALDFYDLYEVMYVMKYGGDVPYADEYTRSEYEIPKKEFEEVIQTYLDADSSMIKNQAVYHAKSKTYRYRPRGLYDSPEPYEPYPEVTGCKKQKDGSLKLTVEAVWARKNTDSAAVSELVIRPLENGRFQYVSNHMVSVSDNIGKLWYTPRLTDEEWERLTD